MLEVLANKGLKIEQTGKSPACRSRNGGLKTKPGYSPSDCATARALQRAPADIETARLIGQQANVFWPMPRLVGHQTIDGCSDFGDGFKLRQHLDNTTDSVNKPLDPDPNSTGKDPCLYQKQ